jgi:hypothetical protein
MRGSRHERLPRRHCGHSAPPVRSGDLQARPDASHEVPVPFSACRSRRAGRGCRVPADAAPWLQETVCSTWRFYALRAALGSVRHVTTVKCSPRVSAVLPHRPLLWEKRPLNARERHQSCERFVVISRRRLANHVGLSQDRVCRP